MNNFLTFKTVLYIPSRSELIAKKELPTYLDTYLLTYLLHGTQSFLRN
jgi:hypothetical protein